MPDPVSRFSFRLPEARQVETYLVELPDGRLVARTREELIELPPELRTSTEVIDRGESEED